MNIPLMPLLATTFLALGALLPGLAAAQPEALDCGPVPATMRAARIAAAGPPQALTVETVPVARPAAGEVLVQVHYAAVNPVDWKLQQAGRLPFPATPGGDFAGVVVALGAGVTGFACGDRVAGIVDQVARPGSYAEYVAVPATEIVPAPAALSLAEAAAWPTVAVAAWRYLVEAAGVQAGERVLVHGGAGGVGSLVVQIAKARGAHVIATASARNHDFLHELGADQTIDYQTTRFEEAVRGVDIVIDTVGGDTLARSPAVLRDGGRLVTLVGTVPANLCADGRIACPATPPWRVRPALEAVAPLIASGQVRIHIERTWPLAEVVEAQEHNRSGRTRGKVVIAMPVALDPSVQDGLAREGDPTAGRPRP
ncbi:MAG: NADP-dependent oxidoreductase [Xanthomonadales bacterium]|nr:NADP-dependent oxidoreductase [Xanthomonadales bacterium]